MTKLPIIKASFATTIHLNRSGGLLLFAVRYMKRNLLQNDEIISKIERLVVIQEQKQSTHFSTKESDE